MVWQPSVYLGNIFTMGFVSIFVKAKAARNAKHLICTALAVAFAAE